jgi:hypothetical protein
MVSWNNGFIFQFVNNISRNNSVQRVGKVGLLKMIDVSSDFV